MPAVFASAAASLQTHSRSTRAELYKKKRKSEAVVEADGDDAEAQSSTPQPRGIPHGVASLTAADAEQYRIAGHSLDEELPNAPFPHQSLTHRKRAPSRVEVHRELATLDPPLLASTAPHSPGLHERHAAVLSTILHRSLVQGDFERAEKAWSILLRTSSNGVRFDVRSWERWGIGAEILLRRDTSNPGVSEGRSDDEHDSHPMISPSDYSALFTKGGFKAAQEYYELLCRTYSARKTWATRGANAAQFYPAMFGLWIAEVVERSQIAHRQLEQSRGGDDSDANSPSPQEPRIDWSEDDHESRQEIYQAELDGAREISTKIDELVQVHPHDQNPQLLHLRAMVSLWLADLITRMQPLEGRQDEEYKDQLKSEETQAREFSNRTIQQGGAFWEAIHASLV